MVCPSCGDDGAIAGLNLVYCPNISCTNFDETRLDEVVREAEEKFDLDPPFCQEDVDTEEILEVYWSILQSISDYDPSSDH